MDEDKIPQEELDEKLVNDAFQELLDSYLSSRHRKKVDLVTKAFNFARQAHKGVRRLSGEPYIMHPIAVALIACKRWGLVLRASARPYCMMSLKTLTTP